MKKAAQHWRVRQIRFAVAVLNLLGRLPIARQLIALFRALPVSRRLYNWTLGYQRPFKTLQEAEAAVATYSQRGHENPANVDLHLGLNKTARPSDYAALFHISRLLPNIKRVFDLGGNVGNLYYCYCNYLSISDRLHWQIHDLPENMARGRTIALKRGADRLTFAEAWVDASGADLLLISGALHYMHEALASMLLQLEEPPEHILINRTPLTEGAPFATIQDAGDFRVACMVHNRQALIGQLEQVGYILEDSWRAAEHALKMPADPMHSVPSYSGMLLRRRDRN
jgi:putative methyltransferase (TIGR04325 family)